MCILIFACDEEEGSAESKFSAISKFILYLLDLQDGFINRVHRSALKSVSWKKVEKGSVV